MVKTSDELFLARTYGIDKWVSIKHQTKPQTSGLATPHQARKFELQWANLDLQAAKFVAWPRPCGPNPKVWVLVRFQNKNIYLQSPKIVASLRPIKPQTVGFDPAPEHHQAPKCGACMLFGVIIYADIDGDGDTDMEKLSFSLWFLRTPTWWSSTWVPTWNQNPDYSHHAEKPSSVFIKNKCYDSNLTKYHHSDILIW